MIESPCLRLEQSRRIDRGRRGPRSAGPGRQPWGVEIEVTDRQCEGRAGWQWTDKYALQSPLGRLRLWPPVAVTPSANRSGYRAISRLNSRSILATPAASSASGQTGAAIVTARD